MTTRVVHIRDKLPGFVYIGRAVPRSKVEASKWGNPFRDGMAVSQYRDYLITPDNGRHLLADVPAFHPETRHAFMTIDQWREIAEMVTSYEADAAQDVAQLSLFEPVKAWDPPQTVKTQRVIREALGTRTLADDAVVALTGATYDVTHLVYHANLKRKESVPALEADEVPA